MRDNEGHIKLLFLVMAVAIAILAFLTVRSKDNLKTCLKELNICDWQRVDNFVCYPEPPPPPKCVPPIPCNVIQENCSALPAWTPIPVTYPEDKCEKIEPHLYRCRKI